MNQDATISASADAPGPNDQIASPYLPVAGQTSGPLIKSPTETQPENSQPDESLANSEDEA